MTIFETHPYTCLFALVVLLVIVADIAVLYAIRYVENEMAKLESKEKELKDKERKENPKK
jgi:hypothetical protein